MFDSTMERPHHWPEVGSIVLMTEDTRAAEADLYVVVGESRAVVYDNRGGKLANIGVEDLFHRTRAGASPAAAFEIFRRGRRDYTACSHQPYAWMDRL